MSSQDKPTLEPEVHDKAVTTADVAPASEYDIQKIKKASSVLFVIISGLALFSDGYNAVRRSAHCLDRTILTLYV